MRQANWITLPAGARGTDAALLLTRMVVGAFLLWGVWDNVLSRERMAEFARFLAAHGFAMPSVMAPLSVYAQLIVGAAFIVGFATRWAGIVCAINFTVALAMVDAKLGIRPAFPATALVLIGLMLATIGAGRWSIDRMLEKNGHP